MEFRYVRNRCNEVPLYLYGVHYPHLCTYVFVVRSSNRTEEGIIITSIQILRKTGIPRLTAADTTDAHAIYFSLCDFHHYIHPTPSSRGFSCFSCGGNFCSIRVIHAYLLKLCWDIYTTPTTGIYKVTQ
jgi:hypothetical protein